MNALNLTDGDIINRQEIVQLLHMALAQQWAFSYVKHIRKRVTTVALKLLSVDIQEGSFTVSCEAMNSQIAEGETVMFRGQSGGISVVFQSRMSTTTDDGMLAKPSSVFQFELPYKVACTQLRKTVRIKLDSVSPVSVILYLTNGAILEGTVLDISTSGAKIRLDKELGIELRNPQLIDACKISLTDDFDLKTGVQVIGMTNDQENNISFLRCQFMQLKRSDEDKLESFIDNRLKQEANSLIDEP